MTQSSFVDYVLHDLFDGISGVSARAMFGGVSFYKDSVIFGMVVDDRLYFKVNENNLGDFKEYNSKPFTYHAKGGKEVAMSYFEVPEEIQEQKEELAEWVAKAVQAGHKKSPQKHTQ